MIDMRLLQDSFQTIYVNNTGSRWVNINTRTGKHDSITLKTETGEEVTRRVILWEQWGNYATAWINWKGKRINVFPDTILKLPIEAGYKGFPIQKTEKGFLSICGLEAATLRGLKTMITNHIKAKNEN